MTFDFDDQTIDGVQVYVLSDFAEWKRNNAQIVCALFDLADDMRRRGHKHWSIRAAMHVVRWQSAMREEPDEGFKINNCWSADLARTYNASVGWDFFRTRDND